MRSASQINFPVIKTLRDALLSVILFFGAFSVPNAPASTGPYFDAQVDPAGHRNYSLALFRLWLSASDRPVKGILAVLPGSDADGTGLAEDPQWQSVAAKWNFALLGITFTTWSAETPYYQAEKGSGEALLEALNQLAVESSRPELKKVPIAMLGHSQGGQFAFHFACWRPDRVIAFAAIKGGYYDPVPTQASRGVPGLLMSGEKDSEFRPKNIRRLFEANQAPSSRWCFAQEPGVGHEVGRCPDLIVPFFNAIISKRTRPCIGDPKDASFVSNANQAQGAWLPNEEVAKTWAEFMKGRISSESLKLQIPGTPPANVAQVSSTSSQVTKIDDDEEGAPTEFHIRPVSNGLSWDSVRALSLRSRCKVSIVKRDGDFLLSVQPNVAGQPLGRLTDSVALRFSQEGSPVLGGEELNLIFMHTSKSLSLSANNFYLGTHSETCEKELRITAKEGKSINVLKTALVSGSAASLEIVQEDRSSILLKGKFQPLDHAGSHSGVFALWLKDPVEKEILIPFIGYSQQSSGK